MGAVATLVLVAKHQSQFHGQKVACLDSACPRGRHEDAVGVLAIPHVFRECPVVEGVLSSVMSTSRGATHSFLLSARNSKVYLVSVSKPLLRM